MHAHSKPYLSELERDTGETTPLEWARYLSETFGTSGALSSLRYYERLGWITPTVREEMITYLRGLSLDELHNKKFDEPETLDQPLSALSGTPFGAHGRSLAFIAEIAGHNLDEQSMPASLAEQRVDVPDEESGELSISDPFDTE